MKKFRFILLLFFCINIYAQTPHPTGTSYPNATEDSNGSKIAVLDENNIINSWISSNDLIANNVNQDNIYRVYDVTSSNFDLSNIASAINALPSFSVDELDIVFFKVGYSNMPEYGTLILTLKDIGKGDYGVGNTQIDSSDLILISSIPFTINDLEELASTQFIELGNIGLDEIQDAFNTHTFIGDENPVQTQEEGYVLVNATTNSGEVQYLFVGAGGEYGVGGNLTAVVDDFTLVSEGLIPNDLWRNRTGNFSVFGYEDWIKHQGNVSFGQNIYVTGNIGSADGDASGRLQITGSFGANFSAGNPNHGDYQFITPSPTIAYPGGKTFNNVILARDYSFLPTTGLVNTSSLRINPTIDFTNTDGPNSTHYSIRIQPTITNINGARHYSIYSESGDVEFLGGTVKIGEYTLPNTDGTANQVLKTDGSGTVTWQDESGGGGGTDDQTASEVPVTDSSFDVLTGTDAQTLIDDIDDKLLDLTAENTPSATELYLDKTVGRNYNLSSANSSTTYTINNDIVINGYARVRINANGPPSFPVGTNQEGGIEFQVDTDMYLIVWSKGTTINDVVYYYVPYATQTAYDYTLPTTDGTSNQVLKTDGSGTVTWQDESGGGSTTFSGLTDTNFTSPTYSQIVYYDEINDEWINKSLAWFDITDYGAVADNLGDSGVDSTTPFNNALDDLIAQGGGVLYFPDTGDDRFNITVNHLTKRDLSNIKIMSFGTGKIFIKDTIGGGGSGQGRGVLVNMDDGTENFTIENMDILVSSGAFRAGFNTGVICSEEGNLKDITIRNCKIKNESKADTSAGVDGITFYRDVTDGADTATITNLVIEDCDIDLYGESVYGIQILRKTYYTNIYHNEVRLRAYTSTTDQAFNAIAMYGDSEYYNIELNYVYSSGHSGIAASMAENGTIRRNWVFNVLNPAEGGIEIEYKESHGSESIASNGTQVYDNYVEGCYYNIMVVQRDADATTYAPFDCIISNNRLRNAIINDIVVASVFTAPAATNQIKNIKILNNDIDSTATGAAIYIYDAIDTTINGNQIRNSAYGIRLGLNSTVYPSGFIEANGNHIYDVTNDAIRVFDMQGLFTADGNKIYNPGGRGIYSNAIVGTPRYKWTNNYCEGAVDGFRSTNDKTSILGCTFVNNTSKDCTGYGHNYANDNSIMVNNISDNCTTADNYASTGGTTTPNIDY